MKVLGITGGVGAGKSTVLSYMKEKYGAYLLECDAIGRCLQSKGEACFKPIVDLFGEEILGEDGELDRQKIAAIVFSDAEMLRKLEQIVHPEVKNSVNETIRMLREIDEEYQPAFVVVESAILLEEQYDLICDEIWYVYASKEARIERLAQSRGYSRERTEQVMASQKPDSFFRERCQFMIDNSGSEVHDTFEQIDRGLIEHGFLYDRQREQR